MSIAAASVAATAIAAAATRITGFAAMEAGARLEPFSFDAGPLQPGELEIEVAYCGVCASDLSMIKNSWKMSKFPLVPGHEIVGRVVATNQTRKRSIGQLVGLGWQAGFCNCCAQCESGDHNLCRKNTKTIGGGHQGGFADRVRCFEDAAIPLPDMNLATAGPLMCGGATVFTPIFEFAKPTDKVAVVGIGGLGHIALQMLSKMGCHVTAFSSNPSKDAECKALGANVVVNSRDPAAIKATAGQFNLIIATVGVALDWNLYMTALAPRGRLHFVGITPPITIDCFSLLSGMKQISGSPCGSPKAMAEMLKFCHQHKIEPMCEMFDLEQCNEALAKVDDGSVRYRAVLRVKKEEKCDEKK